jgi:Nodulin-like/Major Facilitator Superfamily
MLDVRWASLAAGLIIEAVSGGTYAFGVFSPQIKAVLNYTQQEIQTVGSAGSIGYYIAIVAGLAIDSIGVFASMIIGSLLSFIGYFLWYLSASNQIASNVSLVSLYSFLASQGAVWVGTCVIFCGAINFRKNTGTIVGILKSLSGLSASFLTLFYSNMFRPNVNNFLLFLSIIGSVAPFLCSFLLKLAPIEKGSKPMSLFEQKKITFLYISLVVLSLYIISISLSLSLNALSTNVGYPLGMVAILLLISGASLYQPRQKENTDVETQESKADCLSKNEQGASLPRQKENTDVETQESKADCLSKNEQGASFFEGLFSLDMLLVFLILFTGVGSGVAIINNLGTLVQSLGGESNQQDVYVSLVSFSNMVGRLLFGFLSDFSSPRLRRPWFLLVCVTSMGLCCILLAFANLNLLYLGVIWAGVSYGGFWTLSPSFLFEIFGPSNFASMYAISILGPAIASYVLGTTLAATIYTMNSPPGSTICVGPSCYRDTFLILAGLCFFGSICAIFLSLRCRHIYYEDGSLRPYDEFSKEHGVSKVGTFVQTRFNAFFCPKKVTSQSQQETI